MTSLPVERLDRIRMHLCNGVAGKTFDFGKVKLEISEDHVAILTLNDPSSLNSMGPEMLQGVVNCLEVLENTDNGIRCLLMTGEGKGFCSGANLARKKGVPSLGDNNVATIRDPPHPGGKKVDAGAILESVYHPIFFRLRDLPMPFVSAVNGPCVGVGMSMALSADIVIASEKAYFLQAFRNIALVPDGGATFILPRLIGSARAMELSMMGEKLPAAKAFSWGMIKEVVAHDKLMPAAMNLATSLAKGPTKALALMRKLYHASPNNSYMEQLHLERTLQREAALSEDAAEGTRAFRQKRKAKFTGK
jgi:2-(1,2-epoxy-1,2-dihydrophenyl)acetyl-CoA isomerase